MVMNSGKMPRNCPWTSIMKGTEYDYADGHGLPERVHWVVEQMQWEANGL